MKTVTLLIIFVIPLASLTCPSDRLIPQENGEFECMSEAEWEAFNNDTEIDPRVSEKDLTFHLFTNDNQKSSDVIKASSLESLKKSKFNKENPTRIIIHGWQSGYNAEVNTLIRNALFQTGEYNVISVDWSSISGRGYRGAVGKSEPLGVQVANFIDFLNREGAMPFSSLGLIGHSLGAHIAGFAGKNVRNGKIPQIIGLDPAGPLIRLRAPHKQLSSSDADYVEHIQTNNDILGHKLPLGTATFYPHGGNHQPGCRILGMHACCHSRAYEYYAEAILKNGFASRKCNDYKEAIAHKCSIITSVKMGASTNYQNVTGIFYVPVNKKAPYGYSIYPN